MSKEGLFIPGEGFRSREDIRRKMADRGEIEGLSFESPIILPRDVNHYLTRASERAKTMNELSPRAGREVEVRLPRTSIVNIIGDLHFGHPKTDNDRIVREVETIRNSPDSYVILNGDLVDGLFWGGTSQSEQTANLDEQRGFLTSLFKAFKGRIIVATSGEHDSKWASRSGADPYFDFTERTGAPYVRGVAEVTLHVGQQDYKLVTQHKARGHSMYNKNHPTSRQARFSLQDADVYVSSHTHQKQIAQEAIRKFGRSDRVTHISAGAYRKEDDYGDRSGFVSQNPAEMYGCAIRLHSDRKLVDVSYDIIDAHRQWVGK